jgi:hypothetical protein
MTNLILPTHVAKARAKQQKEEKEEKMPRYTANGTFKRRAQQSAGADQLSLSLSLSLSVALCACVPTLTN